MAMRSTQNTAVIPATDQELLSRWQRRCQEGQFSSGVAGLRTVRVFGTAGDEAVRFPRVSGVAELDTLEPDERFALSYAERIVTAKTQQGRQAFLISPGSGETGSRMSRFNPLERGDILILSAISGG